MSRRTPIVIAWIVASVFLGTLLLVVANAQTNALVTPMPTNAIAVFDSQGHVVAVFGITAQIVAALGGLAGFGWLAKFLLQFLPAAKDGTFMAYVVAFLKFWGAATKEKHQADVSLSPTPNDLPPGSPLDSPKTPVEVPMSQQKTGDGLP
jgi:hypothetical protein